MARPGPLSHILSHPSRTSPNQRNSSQNPVFCSVFVWVFAGCCPIDTLAKSREYYGGLAGVNMDYQTSKAQEPICRFGPGGEYENIWPGESQQSESKLIRILGSLAEIITGLLGSPYNAAPQGTPHPVVEEEITQDGVADRIHRDAYAASVTVASGRRRLPGQTILFPDDWRTGAATAPKPKHYLRAHRAVAKKRPALSLAGEGSLFESDLQSARIA